MNPIIVIVISYLLTGVYRIRQDFKQSFHNRPAYARNSSRFLVGFMLVVLTWPVMLYHEVRIHKSIGRALPLTFVFLALIGFGFWLNS
ncbi:hypothetical protein SAMN05444287_0908 [Octadecabacter temperatus]|uniref:Uncharacterized protein n=1 Tax=Octadecabacter temperatus TaxID=1458307 RepID=A0A0K0Y4D0_9RHOB|nr:hypothetical protein [Octadecabacter temperatus]AKS45809.1 hypothetical protein OSB_12540 [Octadecabacter temperatus]SIO01016.1 hypothetical protein SAMN05444287_0908 [Octadecabacter temperatus]